MMNNTQRLSLAATLLGLALAAPSAQAAPSDDYDPSLIEETDHSPAHAVNHSHVLIEPLHQQAEPELVVFLSGSNGMPERHSWILRASAWAGHRTIGLSYDTENGAHEPNPSEVCLDLGLDATSGADCHSDVRLDHILGGSRLRALSDAHTPSPALSYGQNGISPQASVVGELVALLETLSSQDSWYGQFLSPSRIDGDLQPEDIIWEDIVIGGFSQGAGHAQLIATLWGVHGVVAFSGPFDAHLSPSIGGVRQIEAEASWLEGGATPGERRLHMHHLYEDGGAWSDQQILPENLDALGVPKVYAFRPEDLSWNDLVDLDAHRFGTDRTPSCRATAYHGSIAVDTCQHMVSHPATTAGRPAMDIPEFFDLHVHMFQRAGG